MKKLLITTALVAFAGIANATTQGFTEFNAGINHTGGLLYSTSNVQFNGFQFSNSSEVTHNYGRVTFHDDVIIDLGGGVEINLTEEFPELAAKVEIINALLTSTSRKADQNASDIANQSAQVNSNWNKLGNVSRTIDGGTYISGDVIIAGVGNVATVIAELQAAVATLQNGSSGSGSGGLTEADVNEIVDEAVEDLHDTFRERVEEGARTQDTRDTGQDGKISANESAASAANAAATAAQNAATANSGLIAGNTADIATNADGIATNAGNIATNAGNISANSDAIAGNSAAISVNAGNIAVNAQNIAVNAENIAVNAEDIADNTDRILVDADELAALLDTVKSLTDDVANLKEVSMDTEDRIKTLAAENEELTAAALAMSNAGAIATLEEQWKTDPVLGNIELDGLTGKVMHIEVRTGVYEERVARVEDIQTIADRVADNTSRIQLIENAIFVEHKESALVRMMKKLHSDAKIARENNTPFYALTSAGVVDLRGWKGSYTVGANQILIALDKTLAYDVLGLSTVWVALK